MIFAMARAFLIHPYLALARWTRSGIRCSRVPEDLRDYLEGDEVAFPPVETAREETVENGDETVALRVNVTVARESGPIASDADLEDALLLLEIQGRYGVLGVAAVPHVPGGRTDWE